MKRINRTILQPNSTVELQHITGYTAYLFHHLQLDIEIEDIQKLEKNLELIIDKDYGDIFAYRFDAPEPVADFMGYYGNWEYTTNFELLKEEEKLRVKLICRDWTWN